MIHNPIAQTLLKYDSPVAVEVSQKNVKPKRKLTPNQGNLQNLVDFLDGVFVPTKFSQNGIEYVQHVSTIPASRSDVINLDEQLESLLKTNKARNTGICPIKSALYEDCFNEVIRQVSIDSIERASMLIDIKNEIQESIGGYEKLYESASAHGIRKAIHSEQRKNGLLRENKSLETDINNLEEKIKDLRKKMEDTEKNDAAETLAKSQEHNERIATQRAENTGIRQKLEALLVSKPNISGEKNK